MHRNKQRDGGDYQEADYYSMVLEYVIPDGPTRSVCDDSDKGHGNDCPKNDPDNTGSSGPGGGGGGTSGIDSSMQYCAAQGDGTWLTTYTAFCEDSGATVTGYLQWEQDDQGNTDIQHHKPIARSGSILTTLNSFAAMIRVTAGY